MLILLFFMDILFSDIEIIYNKKTVFYHDLAEELVVLYQMAFWIFDRIVQTAVFLLVETVVPIVLSVPMLKLAV